MSTEDTKNIEDIVAAAAAGEPRAEEQLITVMDDIIRRWSGRFLREFRIPVAYRDDVRQEVRLAVLRAAQKKSEKPSYSWESYAYFVARDAVLGLSRGPTVDGFSKASPVRRRAPRISSVREELHRKFGQYPSEREVADRFNATATPTSGNTTPEEVRLVIDGRFEPQLPIGVVPAAVTASKPLVSSGESNAFILRVLARCAMESTDLGLAAEALFTHALRSAPGVQPPEILAGQLGCDIDQAESLLARVYASIVDELGDQYAVVSEWVRQTRSAPLASASELAAAVCCSEAEAERLIWEIRALAFAELAPGA